MVPSQYKDAVLPLNDWLIVFKRSFWLSEANCLTHIRISIIKIRWSHDHLIFIMLNQGPGGLLNIKMSSYQYRDPLVKDETVARPSYL